MRNTVFGVSENKLSVNYPVVVLRLFFNNEIPKPDDILKWIGIVSRKLRSINS